ncbi:MAG: Cytochrome c-type biogenesis protein DsbD, protein-disulfide reductase, partial [uncultured Craurococcus sp.]
RPAAGAGRGAAGRREHRGAGGGLVGGPRRGAAGGRAAGLRQPHRGLVHHLQGQRAAGAEERRGTGGLRRAEPGLSHRRLDAGGPDDRRPAARAWAGGRAALPALPGGRRGAAGAAAGADRGHRAAGAGRGGV